MREGLSKLKAAAYRNSLKLEANMSSIACLFGMGGVEKGIGGPNLLRTRRPGRAEQRESKPIKLTVKITINIKQSNWQAAKSTDYQNGRQSVTRKKARTYQ